MRYILVYDGEVAGSTDDPNTGMPDGFSVHPYNGGESLQQLFFNGQEVLAKPPRPSPNHQWMKTYWKEIVQLPPKPTEPPKQAIYASTLFTEARAIVEEESPLLSYLMLWVYAESLNDKALIDQAKLKVEAFIKQRKSVVSSNVNVAPGATNINSSVTGRNTNP